ncbi:hypothetical protein [Marmoricola sp. URHB0036]|uniref:hypothetical protein n=1 Tax=Marmoricola sp. URHB0036 TaxID=1298863 RepID=UPI00047FC61B|nr:hypothetical protein [Marmoricola sp. URHB0036]
MTEVRPAADAESGRFLLQPTVGWWVLIRCGPPGFDVYVRVAFADTVDPVGEDPTLRQALATLAHHTSTPDTGYAAIWEGWTSGGPAPRAPRLPIPHREMLLFTGPLNVLRDAPALAWWGSAEGCYAEPHLVWPEDQSWCLACDVDEEIEFTVGCSLEAAQALATAMPGAVRRVRYGEWEQLDRQVP